MGTNLIYQGINVPVRMATIKLKGKKNGVHKIEENRNSMYDDV